MAFYAVDVRDRVIQRVTQGYNAVDNKRFFLIEARSAKQAWAKAEIASEPDGSAVCSSCRHSRRVCEEWSVTVRHKSILGLLDLSLLRGVDRTFSKLALKGGV